MKWQVVGTKKGTRCRVLEGGSGAPVVFFHGAAGRSADNPSLDGLARRYHVLAPEWPGYGESAGDELLEDMLDFALHGWDLVDALGLRQPHLVGHSMGGMIAAEMACLAPRDLAKLVLVGAAGLWLEEHPIPDIFAMLPQEIAEVLFVDPARGATLFTGGADLSDIEALKDFYVVTQRRLAMAGKILFPIPNRRLSRRLYPLAARARLPWGPSDRLVAPAHAGPWEALIPRPRVQTVDGPGPMPPREQPQAFVEAATPL